MMHMVRHTYNSLVGVTNVCYSLHISSLFSCLDTHSLRNRAWQYSLTITSPACLNFFDGEILDSYPASFNLLELCMSSG